MMSEKYCFVRKVLLGKQLPVIEQGLDPAESGLSSVCLLLIYLLLTGRSRVFLFHSSSVFLKSSLIISFTWCVISPPP